MTGTHPNLRKLFSSIGDAAGKSRSRKLLALSALLLVFVLVSFVLCSSSYLSLYEPQVYHGTAGAGRRTFPGTGAVLQARMEPEQSRMSELSTTAVEDAALYCDRSHRRTDVCVASGDVRVLGGQQAARLYEVHVVVNAEGGSVQELIMRIGREERVKPYTRKWEESVMNTIDEVKLLLLIGINHGNSGRTSGASSHTNIKTSAAAAPFTCDVQHTVPAILFSTGGYTGNVYHEFNDGLIPLFITAQQYAPGQVVLLLLEYHDWWISRYAEILAQFTNYTIIDLAADKRIHCFPEVTVGLRIHDELSIDPAHHPHHLHSRAASMAGFQSMLHAAYLPRLNHHLDVYESALSSTLLPNSTIIDIKLKPKLTIISRDGSRVLLNQQEVVSLAEEIGFAVHVLSPTPTTEMVEIYGALNGCDAVLGVHGAAMTHLVFMRPGTMLIQVVPLGTEWAAHTYYGEPARKLGLTYVEYKISPRESSLWEHYTSDDPVLADPDSVNSRGGWWETKRIYLQAQNVTVALSKMGVTLRSAYARTTVTRM